MSSLRVAWVSRFAGPRLGTVFASSPQRSPLCYKVALVVSKLRTIFKAVVSWAA
ncbi:hypothetical protein L914_04047 [Phytophthora nicotianae]|uniref:Uncharacterized protein n=2 Tax=Phytophthora nicotianae TaxID=4792 RepID=V9FVK7_PHYNI|nr:hypothetical protein F443_02742 [Phytophthora nicotianae P1569]ETM52319.1 hypothetical protein L914_04047 [Phytophthora nicotianae]